MPTNNDQNPPPASPLASTEQGFIGSTLDGRYFLEKELGKGGMGQVYLAKDLQLHSRSVVVKLLLEEAYKDPYLLKKFRQEIEALSRIHHPGVIGIIDSGELTDSKPFIVMEYVDGVNLRSVIRPEGMNVERVANLVQQIGRALSAAHDKGIFHRDLKPENIMLQNLGHGEELVKIIDFGIAKIKQSVIAASTATTATAGTIAYMAPEQLSAKPVSLSADIYSLGVMAYEMVTGRRPFNPETPFELLEMQRAGVRVKPVDLRPSLSLQAQQLILKALSFEPADRPRTARDFTDELAHALINKGETLELRGHGTPPLQPTDDSFDRTPSSAPLWDGSKTVLDAAPSWNTRYDQSGATLQTPSRPSPRAMFSLNTSWFKVAVSFFSFLVVASALFGVASKLGYVPSQPKQATAKKYSAPVTTTSTADRALTYRLTVQKMRNGKPFKEPFESSGQEIFESGYKFQMNVSSPQSGYLYVLNEGASPTEAMSLTMIYPTPKTNQGSGLLMAGQSAQTGWNLFQGQPGTEQFWMVWSASDLAQFEAARDDAFKNAGTIRDAAVIRTVREFLMKNGEHKPEVKKDTARRETIVKAKGDLLVNLVELEHR